MEYTDLKIEIKNILCDKDADVDIFISYMPHGIDLFLTKKEGCIDITYKLMYGLTQIFKTEDIIAISSFEDEDDCSIRFVIKKSEVSIRPSK